MSEVAREAGVAERTVYTAFGSKRALLFSVVDAEIAGDADAPSVVDRQWFREVLNERDPRRKISLFAAVVRGILERTAAIFAVVQSAAAADPEVAAILRSHREGQSADEQLVVESLAKLGALRPGVSKSSALETVWALTTPRFYAEVADRGWTPDDYESWLRESLTRLLIQDKAPRRRHD